MPPGSRTESHILQRRTRTDVYQQRKMPPAPACVFFID